MMEATVLIPTFDHGPTVRWAVTSALAQTVQDLEVFVVGDGAPDVTRELMAELCAADERVRFFDNPKGPRHGEVHRHAALQEARGRIVAYLGDDDLWFRDHIEVLGEALHAADFAGASLVKVHRDGTVAPRLADLDNPWYLRQLAEGGRSVSLSAATHTAAIYRDLPHGWQTTPEGLRTDAFMWQQVLGMPGVRATSTMRPTVLGFGATVRTDMSSAERAEELAGWWPRLADPSASTELREAITADVARIAAAKAVRNLQLRKQTALDRERYQRLKARRRDRRPDAP